MGCIYFEIPCIYDNVLLADSEREHQKGVDEFYRVCVRRKLRVNTGKYKVMEFERKEVEVLDFSTLYWVNVPLAESCEIVFGEERMEVVKKLKYLTCPRRLDHILPSHQKLNQSKL